MHYSVCSASGSCLHSFLCNPYIPFTIHRIFYLLVSLLFFGTFSKDVDTTIILKLLAYGYITSSNAVLIAIGAMKHTARGITNCNPIHICHLQKLMYIIQIHVKHTVICLIVVHYALCIRECTTHVCVVLMNNFNSHR